MYGLPREVLKWLQTLDLSMTFKNPKRDFANGYLIAEIFGHYYPSEINVHRYSNGHSLDSKLDNWSQLERFFHRKGISISREAIDAVIHCHPGAAVLFLQNTFHLLTGRKIRTSYAPQDQPSTPAFGAFDPYDVTLPRHVLPTTSQLIKTIPNSELIMTKDTMESRRKVRAVVDWQRDAMYRLREHQFGKPLNHPLTGSDGIAKLEEQDQQNEVTSQDIVETKIAKSVLL